MTPVTATLNVNDPMGDVMKKFEKTGSNYLPVTDMNDQLTGFISRNRIYSLYRKMVHDYSAE